MGRHDNKGTVVEFKPALDLTPRPGSYASSIVDFDAEGRPMVEVDGVPMAALATIEVSREDLGREAMITFLESDPQRPVITGLFVAPQAPPRRRHMKIRAEELDFEASSKITLECGKASITLHRDGKIVVRGVHLLSRASGVNRIRGGSIELN